MIIRMFVVYFYQIANFKEYISLRKPTNKFMRQSYSMTQIYNLRGIEVKSVETYFPYFQF